MRADRPTLDGRKQLGVPLIAQHGETRLLVKDLAPERVYHAHRPGPHGADHGMVPAAPRHQLAEQHALVDQVHRPAAQEERAVAQLRFARIRDHGVEAVGTKVIREQDELAVRRHLAPIEDPDAWRGAPPAPPTSSAPLAVGLVQRVEHPMARRDRTDIEAAQKPPHDGKGEKRLRQRIVVGCPGRCLRVVLRDAKALLLREIERVDPRGGAGVGEARIRLDQVLLPFGQTELPPDDLAGQPCAVGPVERSQQPGAGGAQESVVLGSEKPRPQHRAQRPLPEEQAPAPQLRVERRLRLCGELVAQELVIVVHRPPHDRGHFDRALARPLNKACQ